MSRGEEGAPPKLVDVESRASRYKSFEIPSRDEREDLWPGDLAKVILDEVGERIWVRVVDVVMACFYVVVLLGEFDGFIRLAVEDFDNPLGLDDFLGHMPHATHGILDA